MVEALSGTFWLAANPSGSKVSILQTALCLCSIDLAVSPCIYVCSMYLCIYLSVYLPGYMSVHQSFCLSGQLTLSPTLSVDLSVCLPACLAVSLARSLSFFFPLSLSLRLAIESNRSVYLAIRLSILCSFSDLLYCLLLSSCLLLFSVYRVDLNYLLVYLIYVVQACFYYHNKHPKPLHPKLLKL